MNLFQQLFDNYNEYQVTEITTNRFSPEKFHGVLQTLSMKFSTNHLGNSVEGRPIKTITVGSGPVRVLLWSQMHGNESTATRAILDILQLLNEPGKFSALQQNILAKLTICFIPMLNPDGAVHFQRRNALNIDINRDAREFESPESQILKSILADFKPDIAFNLHDQRRFYNINGTGKPSTIAFLAPAYNDTEDIDPTRRKAMQLIAYLRQELETVIPGQIGLYDDTYTPRAFGDYAQRTGTSTILVESGWERNDQEKEFVRKLNFALLISAFDTIAKNSFINTTVDNYMAIPMNDERLFDLLIRNVGIKKNDGQFKIDIGIQQEEESIEHSTEFCSRGEIADIGDLDGWHGFTEIDGRDLIAQPGLVWQQHFETLDEINSEKATELVRQGYLFIKVQHDSPESYVKLPLNIVPEQFIPNAGPVFEDMANLLLRTGKGELVYVVINGFLWKIDEPLPAKINGLVIK